MGTAVIPATLTRDQYVEAIGWLSTELALRAGASGGAPAWLPLPGEWFALAEQAVADSAHTPVPIAVEGPR